MPLYRYSGSSSIDEVRFLKNEAGGQRAYLHAPEDSSPETLQNIATQLHDSGYVTVPCHIHGRSVLEVRGFKTPEQLRASLGEIGATSGVPIKDKLAEDKMSISQWFKRNALIMIAGVYLASDWFYIKYEDVNSKEIKDRKKAQADERLEARIKEYNATTGNNEPLLTDPNEKALRDSIEAHNNTKVATNKFSLEKVSKKSASERFWETLAGKGYLFGSSTSLASLLLRGDTTAAEVGEISRKVKEAADKHGLLPEEDAVLMHASTLQDMRSKPIKEFSKYSSELMNMSFATAGLAITKGNIEHLSELREKEKKYAFLGDYFKNDERHQSDKSVAIKDIVLGIGTMTSGVASSFMKERKHDPNKPKKKGLAGVIERMKENPLSIAGAGYLVSTFIHLWSSIQEQFSIRRDNADMKAKGSTEEPFPIKHTYYRLMFVVMNLIAETAMLFTSKGHGEGVRSDATIDDTAAAMMAGMIARRPKEEQPELIQKMAKELSTADSISKPVAEVEKMIRTQLKHLEQNPWAKKANPSQAGIKINPEKLAGIVPAPSNEAQELKEAAHYAQQGDVAPELVQQSEAEKLAILTPREKTPPAPVSLLERATVSDAGFALNPM